MYKEYFGLKENPFSISPDPHYFYMSAGHREALAHMVYGVEAEGGFILLTGEVGTGKTTVCRCLLGQMPDHAEIAFILNPKLTVDELLASICDEFGIAYPPGNTSNKIFISAINDYLMETHGKGHRAILIIEEAQNLSVEVLEQIRLLTNLETNQRKLLQIILLGQPELREMLARPELRQLSQRITARYHLEPLSREEISAYIDHRLSIAGLLRGKLFPRNTLRPLFRLTGGIPRLINIICDRALIGAYVQGEDSVDRKTLYTAAREAFGQRKFSHSQQKKNSLSLVISLCILFVLCLAAVTYYFIQNAYLLQKQEMTVSLPMTYEEVNALIASEKKETLSRSSLPETLDIPSDVSPKETEKIAYKALFALWQAKYEPRDKMITPCSEAAKQGLFCFGGKGSLPDLKQMNKPAVLKLIDGKGNQYYATITSLTKNEATFTLGNKERIVDITEIVKYWTGEYTLLWKPPKGFKEEHLKPGGKGSFVLWVKERLAHATREQGINDSSPIYGNNTEKEVKRFQISVGLIPDGIIGVRTVISLADAAGEGGPVLASTRGGK